MADVARVPVNVCADALPIKTAQLRAEAGAVRTRTGSGLHVDGARECPYAGPWPCTGLHDFHMAEVFGIDGNVHQVVSGVRCAPAHAVHPQRDLLKRPPADANVRLNAPGSSGLDVHPRNEFQCLGDRSGGLPFSRLEHRQRLRRIRQVFAFKIHPNNGSFIQRHDGLRGVRDLPGMGRPREGEGWNEQRAFHVVQSHGSCQSFIPRKATVPTRHRITFAPCNERNKNASDANPWPHCAPLESNRTPPLNSP